jgi:hypothetical protein
VNHVASDIAGAAGDQDRHAGGPLMPWRRRLRSREHSLGRVNARVRVR